MKILLNKDTANKSGIYKIYNTVNNKIYVGSASNFSNRATTHKSLLNTNKHHNPILQHFVNKHGIDKLIFEPIIFCDKDNLIIEEQNLINLLKPLFNVKLAAGAGAPKGSGHGKSNLDEEKVYWIKKYLSSKISCRIIASLYGVSRESIQDIKKGRTWTHVNIGA